MLKLIETTQAEVENARLQRSNSRREVLSKIKQANSTTEVADSDQTKNMLSNWFK